MVTLVYDGTFDGFLTSVFISYEMKYTDVSIVRASLFQKTIFGDTEQVITDKTKADRVWNGFKKRVKPNERYRFYYAFLSEHPSVENTLLQSMQYIFSTDEHVASDYTHAPTLTISKLAKNVSREKHRMEAFVRFKLTKDAIYFANISPDFNVLPLLIKHFKSRYADQQWLIYDLKRNYGLYYNLDKVTVVQLEFDATFDPTKTSSETFAPIELEFQQLWKDYFKSTNIASRKNMRLHVQHVPKRYWKYLSEKQPN